MQSILCACKQAGGQAARRVAEAFIDQVGHRLLSAADAVQAVRERNAYYDGSSVFKQHADAFKRDLRTVP